MKPVVPLSLLAACATLLSGAALAQGTTTAGPKAAAPAASAAAGMGPRMGRGPGARWGADYTPGWPMMNSTERDEHRGRMQSFKTYEECKAYMDQHHQQMTERAKERGRAMPMQPRRDACAGLKKS